MWRTSLITTAMIVGAVCGVWVGIESPRVEENLKHQIMAAANKHLGWTVAIDELHLLVLPPTLEVEGLRIYQKKTASLADVPWVTVHHASTRVHPWPSLSGAVIFDDVLVDGLVVSELDVADPMGFSNMPPTPQDPEATELLAAEDETDDGRHLPIDIRSLRVLNANIKFHGDGWQAQGAPFELHLKPGSDGGRDITVELGSGKFIQDGLVIPVELKAQATLEGTIDEPGRLTLTKAELWGHGAHLDLSGFAFGSPDKGSGRKGDGKQDNGERFGLKMAGDIDLGKTDKWSKALPVMTGTISLDAQVKDAGAGHAMPRLRLRAKSPNLTLANEVVGAVEIDLVTGKDLITIDAIKVDHPSAGAFTGSGSVHLSSSPYVDFDCQVLRASLPHILARGGVPDAWVRLGYTGRLKGRANLSPFRATVDTQGTVSEFQSLADSYRNPESEVYLQLSNVGASGRVSLNETQAELENFALTTKSTAITLNGSLNYAEDLTLDLRAQADSIDLSDLGSIAGISMAGTGSLAASLEGPAEEVVISGTADIADYSVDDFVVGDTKATVIFSGLKLQIGRAAVQSDSGEITGRGSLRFDRQKPLIDASLSLARVPMSHALQTLGLGQNVAGRFGGIVGGTLELQGLLENPQGGGTLKVSNLKIDGTTLGDTDSEVSFGGPEALVTIQARAQLPGGRAKVNFAWRRGPEPLSLSGTIKNLQLGEVRDLIGDLDAAGVLTASFAVDGPLDALDGTLSATTSQAEISGLKLGKLTTQGTLAQGTLSLSGQAVAGRIGYTAKVKLGEKSPFSFRGEFANLQPERLYELPKGLTGNATGSLFAQGDLSDPQSIVADIEVTKVAGLYNDLSFSGTRTWRFHYGSQELTVVDLGLQGPRLTAGASGKFKSDGTMALKINGDGDLAVLRGNLSVDRAEGAFQFSAEVGGTVEAPLVKGSGAVKNATVGIHDIKEPLEKLSADLLFSGRAISIRAGRAMLGGGPLSFTGEVVQPVDDDAARIDSRTTFDSVKLTPDSQLSFIASGNLSLAGPVGDLLLSGRVNIGELRYTKKLELSLDSLLPKKDAPLRVPDFAPGQTVALSVRLSAPDEVFVLAGQVEAEFKADLLLTGTTKRTGLRGSLTPLWGKARLRDIEFTLEGGSIDFLEEFRIFAQYQLAATAEGCDMRMRFNIRGDTSPTYNVIATGNDNSGPVHPQDPWSCISFGLRLSEHAGNTALTAGSGRDSAGLGETLEGGLDILWGVSGIDSKVKSILPYFDEVRLTTQRSGRSRRVAPRLVVAKDVGDKLQLKYSGALDEPDDHILSLEYELSKVATLQGSWVSAGDIPVGDLGVDLRLQWEFE